MADQTIIDGNFAFTYAIDPKFYKQAYVAEQQARINFRASGHAIREAMEQLMIDIISDYHIGNYVSQNPYFNKNGMKLASEPLGMQYRILRQPEEMQAAGVLPKGSTKNAKLPLPFLGSTTFYMFTTGQRKMDNTYEFLRRLGNTCSHSTVESSDIQLSYQAILAGLRAMHSIAVYHWGKKATPKPESFNEYRMPIDHFHIMADTIPHDSKRSRCMHEFKAFLADEKGRPSFYAILRMYDRTQKADKNFILRNQKSFEEASSVSIDIPEGMTRLREVTPANSSDSSFYIIAYIFNREPQPLSSAILKEMSATGRLKMCDRIAHCLYDLHYSEIPISHRMLNYECVYVCKYKDWVPYVIKFDYAKITNTEDPAKTVFMNAQQARKKVAKEEILNKYVAPEWDQLDQNSDDKIWQKVDIYSLGVLLSDILYGSIPAYQVDLMDLQEDGVDDELLELLDTMISDDPNIRPDIREVCKILDRMSMK